MGAARDGHHNESARYNLAHPFRTTAASYRCSSHAAREPSTAKLACASERTLGNGLLCGAVVG